MSEPLIDPTDIADLVVLDESSMQDACTITIDGVPIGQTATGEIIRADPTIVTTACSFVAPRSGDTRDAQQRQEQGSYTLYIPLRVICPQGAHVAFGGRVYRVVFTPPPAAYSTSKVVGLEDT